MVLFIWRSLIELDLAMNHILIEQFSFQNQRSYNVNQNYRS